MEYKPFLDLAALILGIVNGFFLLKFYFRDKARISAKAVWPEFYQWYFKLPPRIYKGTKTRKYGFLTYLDVSNKGLRDVSLESWNLYLRTKLKKWIKLPPISIPEPQGDIGASGNVKIISVLGQKGLFHEGSTMIKSGGSISGMSYYIAEFYGGGGWDPLMKENKAVGRIIVRDIFGNSSKVNVLFTKISLERVKRIIENIDKIDLPPTDN